MSIKTIFTYWLRSGISEKSFQVPSWQKLKDNKSWVLFKANPDEMNNVRMFKLVHYQCFHQKVHFSLGCYVGQSKDSLKKLLLSYLVRRKLWKCLYCYWDLNIFICTLFIDPLIHLSKCSLAKGSKMVKMKKI